MKKTLLTIILIGLAMNLQFAWSQINSVDTTDLESFDELLISAQRFSQKRSESPRQIEVLTSQKINETVPATLGDAIIQSGKAFVQKSQMGGSSPVLRGFEASRILLVVDGVRMNNATYRAGHLQDIITVDPFVLDRMEINFGSGSTLFGSDALGGIIFLKTKDAEIGSKKWGGFSNIRYLSSSNSIVLNGGLNYRSEKLGWILNLTRSQFGDLRMGSNSYFKEDPNFGTLPKYVSQVNGRDTVLMNDDPSVQKGTGYNQNDIFTKLKFKSEKLIHILNIQGSFSDIIPRYDRMSTVDGLGNFNQGRWDYSPQNRQFYSYTLQNLKGNNRLILGNQRTKVGRITRPFGGNTERSQIDRVSMWTLNADNQQRWNKITLNSGFEWVYNYVNSIGLNRNIITGNESITKARYADSGAQTYSTSLFTQGIYKNKNTVVQGGLRITHYSLSANFSKSNPWKLPYDEISFRNTGLSYDFGITQKLNQSILVKASYNQAFRNPNVDDMTKVFESLKGVKLLVPSPDLKAEVSRTIDLGLSMSNRKGISGEVGIYRSQVSNLLLDQPGKFNGEDSIIWDGSKTPVFQMVNVSSAFIWGYYGNIRLRVLPKLWLNASYTYTYGRFKALDDAEYEPLDHIPPVFGQLSIKYQPKDYWYIEAQYLFNGMKKADDYSNSGEDNANQNPMGGNPSWGIFNLRTGYTWKNVNIQLNAENLFDLRYRYFASGVSASGRSLNVTLGYKF